MTDKPIIQRQSSLSIYGDGPFDAIMGREVGCADVGHIKLSGYELVPTAELNSLIMELTEARDMGPALAKTQKDRLLAILNPHLEEQNDIAIALAAILTEPDSRTFFMPDQPKEAGWYWYRELGGEPGMVQILLATHGGVQKLCMKSYQLIHTSVQAVYHPAEQMKGRWCGPLQPPTWDVNK